MNGWMLLAIAAALIAVGVTGQLMGWLDFTNWSRRGSGVGGALGVIDEIFAPNRHEAEVVLETQEVLPAPAPVPGDGDQGITDAASAASRYEGRIHLTL